MYCCVLAIVCSFWEDKCDISCLINPKSSLTCCSNTRKLDVHLNIDKYKTLRSHTTLFRRFNMVHCGFVLLKIDDFCAIWIIPWSWWPNWFYGTLTQIIVPFNNDITTKDKHKTRFTHYDLGSKCILSNILLNLINTRLNLRLLVYRYDDCCLIQVVSDWPLCKPTHSLGIKQER